MIRYTEHQLQDAEFRKKLKSLGFKVNKKLRCYQAKPTLLVKVGLGLPIDLSSPQNVTEDFLMPYQVKDIVKMVQQKSMLNANDMGLGKTLEAIMYTKYMGFTKPILVVAPKTALGGWKQEILKWGGGTEDQVNIIQGSKKQKEVKVKDIVNSKFTLINYEILQDIPQNIEFDCIIADEAHRIKNHKAKRTKLIKKLKATHRLALTGTPIQNKVDELWSIFDFIDPTIFGASYFSFVYRFCDCYMGAYAMEIKGATKNPRNIKLLHDILSLKMIRHKKKDVLKELPDKQYCNIEIEMTKEQEAKYKEVKKEVLVEIEASGEKLDVSLALTKILRLQQITSCPTGFWKLKENPKIDMMLDLFEQTDSKFIVFSRFSTTIDEIQSTLEANNIRFARVTGNTKDRQKEVDKFQEDPSIKVFIATIRGAGEAITLTKADKVIMFDREWSPAMNQQAEDRCHRKGQKNAVTIYNLICPKTIDTKLEKTLGMKVTEIKKMLEEE